MALTHPRRESPEKLITDAEVFQELLHRQVAIRRREAIEPAWRALEDLVDEVVSIDLTHVERSKELVLRHQGLSARDALHLTVMERRGIELILSFDTGFDAYPGVRRVFSPGCALNVVQMGRFVSARMDDTYDEPNWLGTSLVLLLDP